MSESSFMSDESGVFAGQRRAGFYRSWSKKNDAIDYVGKHWHHSHTQTELADGTSLTWTYENEFRYTGVGEFRAGEGDSGGFNPDGQTGLWYSGVAATLTTTYANETTFYTATTVPSRTFAYPMGSGTYIYTQPGWSSWTKHRWTVESEARFGGAWISWDRYSPAESVDGFFGEEGEERTDTWTWLSQYSYTGPAGHLFEQHFGSATTTTHDTTTTGVPPTDLAVIAAMTAIANQPIGQSTSNSYAASYSTASQGGSGSGGDGGNAAKDLNLAEFFAQAAALPSHQSAWQAAGRSASKSFGQAATQAGAPASDESKDPPERHPESAMPESWLDVLDALRDRAKTAHDDPEQLPALTDAAFAELNAMETPQNAGTPAMQAVAPEGGIGLSGSGQAQTPPISTRNPPRCMACHGGLNAGVVRWENLSREEQIAIRGALNAPWPILGANGPFLEDFLLGQGERIRFYGPDSRETMEMRQSPGAAKLRDKFYKDGCKDVTGFSYKTGEAARESPPWGSTTPAQVGGFMGYAHNNGDGTVTFTIYNEAGTHSFFYHAVPNRTSPTGPMRTIYQRFQWTEKIDKGRCR